MDGHRGGRMVSVGCVDQNVVEWHARRLFDAFGGPVEDVSIDHQHVACDQGNFPPGRILDDHGRCAQGTFLTLGFPRPDPAADDHRIVGQEDFRGRTHLQILGDERRTQTQAEPDRRQQLDEIVHAAGPHNKLV